MRPTVAALLTALLLLPAGGCSGVSPAAGRAVAPERPLAQVEAGMSAGDVESLLGPPVTRERRTDAPGMEVWYYRNGVVILRQERVAFSFAAPPSI
jgi:outer membrane protein assembly factor BamE (lipoprotein component of BamABCDE complex)